MDRRLDARTFFANIMEDITNDSGDEIPVGQSESDTAAQRDRRDPFAMVERLLVVIIVVDFRGAANSYLGEAFSKRRVVLALFVRREVERMRSKSLAAVDEGGWCLEG